MARSASTLNWKSICLLCIILLYVVLWRNSLFVWKQTTILITKCEPNDDHQTQPINSSTPVPTIDHNIPETSISPIDTTEHRVHQNNQTNTTLSFSASVDLQPTRTNKTNVQIRQHLNLWNNPYDNIGVSIYLDIVNQADYISFSDCLFRINADNPTGKCDLSKYITFSIQDVIGEGNHAQILSANIHYKAHRVILPMNMDRYDLKHTLYAMKYSQGNETCNILQFEHNIMKQIQSQNNAQQYHLTDLHELFPWIEWWQINRFTRVLERRCILIMKQLENVQTLESIQQRAHPISFASDGGLLQFVLNCYDDLMTGLQRLWLFNYYHVDINAVNILVSPNANDKKQENVQKQCYLIDYGGVFAMDFDAKSNKEFVGNSHNYSPFAYYNLFLYEQRLRQTSWNATALNDFARNDNRYRILVELLKFFLSQISVERDLLFTDEEWELIADAKRQQVTINYVKPFGINPENPTYIRYIWCLRQLQIQDIRNSQLGSKKDKKNQATTFYDQAQKQAFLELLDILENAMTETKAIDADSCETLIATGL